MTGAEDQIEYERDAWFNSSVEDEPIEECHGFDVPPAPSALQNISLEVFAEPFEAEAFGLIASRRQEQGAAGKVAEDLTPEHWLRLLMEELGEVALEVNDGDGLYDIVEELRDVGALAVAAIASLWRQAQNAVDVANAHDEALELARKHTARIAGRTAEDDSFSDPFAINGIPTTKVDGAPPAGRGYSG